MRDPVDQAEIDRDIEEQKRIDEYEARPMPTVDDIIDSIDEDELLEVAHNYGLCYEFSLMGKFLSKPIPVYTSDEVNMLIERGGNSKTLKALKHWIADNHNVSDQFKNDTDDIDRVLGL